jgi:hypothetical protein
MFASKKEEKIRRKRKRQKFSMRFPRYPKCVKLLVGGDYVQRCLVIAFCSTAQNRIINMQSDVKTFRHISTLLICVGILEMEGSCRIKGLEGEMCLFYKIDNFRFL